MTTICVCAGDAGILLLLRMFYASSSFFVLLIPLSHPHLRSLLVSGNERDNWNFNAKHKMVSIRGRLL